MRDSLVDEGFAARARAADGGDVELQRAARDAQAVPAGGGFDDAEGGGGGGGGGDGGDEGEGVGLHLV